MQQPREMVTMTKTMPLEATRNNNQQTIRVKNEEAVMMAPGNEGLYEVRWTQQRQ